MAAQFGALAGGIGVGIAALNGIGDALGSLNDYQLEPTAANAEKLAEEFRALGPAGREFVVFLDSVTPQLQEMQQIARQGVLPGLADGIEGFLERGPQLNRIIESLSESVGDLMAAAGEGLGGPAFDEFFAYLESDAGPLLLEFGRSLGNVAEGFANLFVAFAPVSSQFSGGLEQMTARFAEFSRGLDQNDGFQSFLDYLQENGPAAVDFLGSLVGALASLVEAAAPIGQAILPALTGLLDVFSAIAGNDVGSALLAAAAGFVAFNRASKVLDAVSGRFDRFTSSVADGSKITNLGRQATVAAGSVGVLGLSMTDLDERMGIANAAMGALAGAMVAGPLGAAIGGTLGGFMDLVKYGGGVEETLERIQSAAERSDYTAARQGLHSLREEIRQYEDPSIGDAIGNVFQDIGWSIEQTFNGRGFDIGLSRLDDLEAAAARAEAAVRGVAQDGFNPANALAAAFGSAMNAATGSMESAENRAAELAESLARVNRLLDKRASVRDYEAALDDFTDAVRRNGNTMDITTRKGRENEAALDNIASTAIKVAENLKGVDRQKTLTQARRDILDSIDKLGLQGAELQRAEALVDRLDQAKAEPEVNVDISKVQSAIQQVRNMLSFIPDETVNVWVTRRNVNGGGMGPVDGFAAGSHVPSTRPATALPAAL